MISVLYCVYMRILHMGLVKMATLDKSHVDLEVDAGPGSNNDGNRDHRDSTITSHSSDQDDHPQENRASIVSVNEIVGVLEKGRRSSASDCSVEVDLEAGFQETKLHLSKSEKDCRICQLSLDATNQESELLPIELGCSCKDDLAAAHKQCAEAWFKIKGNKICEICGSIACNVAGANEADLTEQWNESNDVAGGAAAPTPSAVSRNFWQGHRFLNFLLACMVFAFVISWLFHFNVPS